MHAGLTMAVPAGLLRCTTDSSTPRGLIWKHSICWLQELKESAVPILQQLRLVQLQREAGISNPGWRGLLDLLLKLQSSLPKGGIAELLLLLVRHTLHAQQLGQEAARRPDSQSSAFQLGRRQAAGLQTCLAALLPLWALVACGGRQISLAAVSRSLLLAALKRHLEKKGADAIKHDIRSETGMYKETDPKLPALLLHIMEVNTVSHFACNPSFVQLANFWAV